jgi:hypothetical protein
MKRFKHSQFLVRDHFLIVIFGYRDEFSFSDYAEWIDLRNPDKFREIEIRGEEKYFVLPKIIEIGGQTYLIGGKKQKETRRLKNSRCPLYEILVIWDEQGQPDHIEIKVSGLVGPNEFFKGNPSFSQTLPNHR